MAPNELGSAPNQISGITASASTAAGGWPASNLFDDIVGGASNSWSASTAGPAWVIAQLAAAQATIGYKITARLDAPNSCPSAWTFEGSSDGTNWVVIDTQISQTWTAGSARTYFFTKTAQYSYYRLNITNTQGGGATWPSFTEWTIYAGSSGSMIDWWAADLITGVADGALLPAANIVDSYSGSHVFTTSARQAIYRAASGPSGKPFIDGSTTSGFSYAGSSTNAPSGDLTYFAVVRTNSAAAQSIIGSVSPSNGAQLRLINYTVQLDQNNISTVATSNLKVPTGEWVIIIASYSRDTGSFTVNIQGNTETIAGPVGRNFANPGTLSLGSIRGTTTDVWLGGIAEVGRYTSVLSPSDQTDLYNYLFTKYFTGPVTSRVESAYVEAVTTGSANAQVEATYVEAITAGSTRTQVETAYAETIVSGIRSAQTEAIYIEALMPVQPAQVESIYTESLLTSVPPSQIETIYTETMLTTTPAAVIEGSYLEVMLIPSAGPLPFKGWGMPI